MDSSSKTSQKPPMSPSPQKPQEHEEDLELSQPYAFKVAPSFNLDNLSMLPADGKQSIPLIINSDSDDVSQPTVQTFDDEDFSLATEKDFLATHEMHIPSKPSEDNENLSLSSINTKGLLQITELNNRLRIQEATKLELLNQCLILEERLEKNDCKHAHLKIYKQENMELRETQAKMERDFMNDMNEIVTRMADMEKEYSDKLDKRDKAIRGLVEELKLLKMAKNLDDDVSTSI